MSATEYAKVDANGVVTEVIVIEPDMLATGRWGDPAEWVLNDPATKKNPAGIGHTYDKARKAFISPKPFPSWVLDEATCLHKAPVAIPADGKRYQWDEGITQWRVAVSTIVINS